MSRRVGIGSTLFRQRFCPNGGFFKPAGNSLQSGLFRDEFRQGAGCALLPFLRDRHDQLGDLVIGRISGPFRGMLLVIALDIPPFQI
ncbi:hypothetical protein D3C81_1287080 [compost metagenome]